MTVQECYDRMGADYEDLSRRLRNEEMVRKLLGMLLRDGSMAELRTSLANGDYETAFRASHTLKGIALNLGLTRLTGPISALTEALRPQRQNEQIEPLFQKAEQLYQEMVSAVSELLEAGEKAGLGQ